MLEKQEYFVEHIIIGQINGKLNLEEEELT